MSAAEASAKSGYFLRFSVALNQVCNRICSDRARDRYTNGNPVTIIDTELHDAPGLQPEINRKASNGAETTTIGNTAVCSRRAASRNSASRLGRRGVCGALWHQPGQDRRRDR